MLARCRVHEVSQEWGCEWGSSYMNESIHSVSSHDCRFLPSRMRGCSLVITQVGGGESSPIRAFGAQVQPVIVLGHAREATDAILTPG